MQFNVFNRNKSHNDRTPRQTGCDLGKLKYLCFKYTIFRRTTFWKHYMNVKLNKINKKRALDVHRQNM